jgi:protein NrfD
MAALVNVAMREDQVHRDDTRVHLAQQQEIALLPYSGITYYDIAPLKPTAYKWKTAAAFFSNNIAGGSQVLALIIEQMGGPPNRCLVRTGRYLAAGGGIVGTALLISELHTRQRWFNMLRLYKRTSPMSIGIWCIAPFVAGSTLAALGEAARARGHGKSAPLAAKVFGMPAAVLGTMVMTYLGTELEATNVPLWAVAHPWLAPFYAASGISGAAAALQIQAETSAAPLTQRSMLNRIALISGIVETTLAMRIAQRWHAAPAAGFFRGSVYNGLFCLGVIGMGSIVPLMINAVQEAGGRRNVIDPRLRLIGPALKLAGGLLRDLVMIYAGKQSTNQPRDYFQYAQLPSPQRSQKSGPSAATAPIAHFGLAVGAAVLAGAVLGWRLQKRGR